MTLETGIIRGHAEDRDFPRETLTAPTDWANRLASRQGCGEGGETRLFFDVDACSRRGDAGAVTREEDTHAKERFGCQSNPHSLRSLGRTGKEQNEEGIVLKTGCGSPSPFFPFVGRPSGRQVLMNSRRPPQPELCATLGPSSSSSSSSSPPLRFPSLLFSTSRSPPPSFLSRWMNITMCNQQMK